MSGTTTVAIEGIDTEKLSPKESNALCILRNLTVENLNNLKKSLGIGGAGVIGSQTLDKFIETSGKLGFDLSENGVNAFKDLHKLRNSGADRGVIGPQTAETYFKEFLEALQAQQSPNRINQAGLELIKFCEGLECSAYVDAVGILTIGYGHTGPDVTPGLCISPEQAEALLKKDLQEAEAGVRELVKVPLNSNQFSSLVSFVFNVGSGNFAESTLLRLLNAGDYKGASEQFGKWVKGDNGPLPGLVDRREKERQLFLKA